MPKRAILTGKCNYARSLMDKIWAISDPHLSFGVPDKRMDVFGSKWEGYTHKFKENWQQRIHPGDLVLIPGDISWGMSLDDALPDLQWLHALPGIKVLLKGNHDYWWGSLSKIEKVLPPSLHLIQNNAFFYNGVAVGGSRLWDTPEFNFADYINYTSNPKAKEKNPPPEDDAEKIYSRELQRLEMSLKQLDPHAKLRIALTHYPPIGADLKESAASKILEKYQINVCIFGHLHNVKEEAKMFGEKNGVTYILASCDYLDFKPLQISL